MMLYHWTSFLNASKIQENGIIKKSRSKNPGPTEIELEAVYLTYQDTPEKAKELGSDISYEVRITIPIGDLDISKLYRVYTSDGKSIPDPNLENVFGHGEVAYIDDIPIKKYEFKYFRN